MRYVRFRADGDQIGKSISAAELVHFDDLDYREVPEGYVEGETACKLDNLTVVLMSAPEYAAWIDKYYTKHDPTLKEAIKSDYEHRAEIGVDIYKDFQAEIVVLFHGGSPLETIVPLEAKFKPILDGLKTGDFITAMVGLSSIATSNQTEEDYRLYTLGVVNATITENNWLQS